MITTWRHKRIRQAAVEKLYTAWVSIWLRRGRRNPGCRASEGCGLQHERQGHRSTV